MQATTTNPTKTSSSKPHGGNRRNPGQIENQNQEKTMKIDQLSAENEAVIQQIRAGNEMPAEAVQAVRTELLEIMQRNHERLFSADFLPIRDEALAYTVEIAKVLEDHYFSDLASDQRLVCRLEENRQELESWRESVSAPSVVQAAVFSYQECLKTRQIEVMNEIRNTFQGARP